LEAEHRKTSGENSNEKHGGVAIGKAPSSRDIRELTVTSPATQQIPRYLGSPVSIVRRSRQGDTSIASRVEIAEPISHQLQLRESEADPEYLQDLAVP
jgi:hypothetical protein